MPYRKETPMPQASIQYPTAVVNGKINANAGYHPKGKRAYRNAVNRINSCLLSYREPRLHHLCFQESTNTEHKRMLHALVQHLDRKGIPCEWFSAREVDSMKGEHLHVFMLVDSSDYRSQAVLNGFEEGFLGSECLKRNILLHINRPQNDIHEKRKHAALPYLGPGNQATEAAKARLADSLIWLSYIYKLRGKPDADDKKADSQIFSSSRPNRKRSAADGKPIILRPSVVDVQIDDAHCPAVIADRALAHWATQRDSIATVYQR